MKKLMLISSLALLFLMCASCSQKTKDSENTSKIENTLKSVSFWYDSIGINPQELWLTIEKVNKIIDTIGYPDAGYKLWLVQSDTNKTYRFMMEGYWPDQAIYDIIHNHEKYKNSNPATKAEEELWKALKNVSYNRFTIVK